MDISTEYFGMFFFSTSSNTKMITFVQVCEYVLRNVQKDNRWKRMNDESLVMSSSLPSCNY